MLIYIIYTWILFTVKPLLFLEGNSIDPTQISDQLILKLISLSIQGWPTRIYTASLITLTSWVITTAIKPSVIPKLDLMQRHIQADISLYLHTTDVGRTFEFIHYLKCPSIWDTTEDFTLRLKAVKLNRKKKLTHNLMHNYVSTLKKRWKSITYLTFWACHTAGMPANSGLPKLLTSSQHGLLWEVLDAHL